MNDIFCGFKLFYILCVLSSQNFMSLRRVIVLFDDITAAHTGQEFL